VTNKADNSPLTAADTAAHGIILEGLRKLPSQWPVLSEESKHIPYDERKRWEVYWLVDPLDGTKEFIKKNGEFTVNVALVRSGLPVLGVVHVPVRHVTYYAEKGKGAFKKLENGKSVPIRAQAGWSDKLKIVLSRSHRGGEMEVFLQKAGPYESVSMGSSLKLCLVAEGQAHLYPRFWPSMEWDTAAAQCVVTEAGGTVTDLQGRPLVYNKESLLNTHFLASASGQDVSRFFGP
jgi:3'(2'), 5'-bisphosphate nucleotidase